MSLKELVKKVFKGKKIREQFIGIYEEDEKGNPKPIYPEYADELLETHGELIVENYQFVQSKNVLVVEFAKQEESL